MKSATTLYKVLIIDDSVLIGSKLTELLSGLPRIKVLQQATSIKEGWDLCRSQLPDIIFLDLHFPVGNGLEIIKKIKTKKLPCTVVVFSNFENKFFYKDYLKLGAHYILDKTIELNKIPEIVSKIITGKNVPKKNTSSSI